jgi:hypothetical protein
MDMDKSYVYALRISGEPFVKIGYSGVPSERKYALNCALKRRATVEIVCTTSVPIGSLYERVLHRHFRECRVMGEWFAIADNETIQAAFCLERMTQLLCEYTMQGAIRLKYRAKDYMKALIEIPVMRDKIQVAEHYPMDSNLWSHGLSFTTRCGIETPPIITTKVQSVTCQRCIKMLAI